MDLCTNISTNILLAKESKLQRVTYNVVTTVLKTTINNLTKHVILLGHTHVCECTEGERLKGPAPTDPRNHLQGGGRRGRSGQRILDFLPVMLEIFARKKYIVCIIKTISMHNSKTLLSNGSNERLICPHHGWLSQAVTKQEKADTECFLSKSIVMKFQN